MNGTAGKLTVFILLFGLVLALGCKAPGKAPASSSAQKEPSAKAGQKTEPPSWATLGQPFVTSYCIRCHTDPPVEGAPNTIQTLEEVRQNIQGIYQRVVFTDNMPPNAPFPTANEEDQLRIWLELGAPR
jgi:uncharacterized membrane protein